MFSLVLKEIFSLFLNTNTTIEKLVLLYLVNHSCVKASSFWSCSFTRAWSVELLHGPR